MMGKGVLKRKKVHIKQELPKHTKCMITYNHKSVLKTTGNHYIVN